MRVLFIASLGTFTTANYWLNALKHDGHHVFCYSDQPSAEADAVGKSIIDAGRLCTKHGFEPDLLLFVEGGTMRLFPVGLERLDCLTAWYGIDTHMDYAKHLALSRAFDLSFIAQKEYVECLRADGIHQVHWLPLAFDPQLLTSPAPARDLDVAYVGSMNRAVHSERHACLRALQARYPANFVGPAAPSEMAAIYSRAKIVFNKSVNNDVNMRYFEAMGCGAALVTDSTHDNGASDLFEEGIHYVTYADQNSMLQAVEHLLGNEEVCREIGDRARELICARHTYVHRIRELMDVVARSARQPRPGIETYFAVFSRLRLVEGVLCSCLAALSQEGYGRLDRLAARIAGVPVRCAAWAAGGLTRIAGWRHRSK